MTSRRAGTPRQHNRYPWKSGEHEFVASPPKLDSYKCMEIGSWWDKCHRGDSPLRQILSLCRQNPNLDMCGSAIKASRRVRRGQSAEAQTSPNVDRLEIH